MICRYCGLLMAIHINNGVAGIECPTCEEEEE